MGKASPLQCAAASFILPGFGHLLRGRYARGGGQIGIVLLCAAIAFLILKALGLGPGWMEGFDIRLKGYPLIYTLIPTLGLAWLYAAYEAYEFALRDDRKAEGIDARAAVRERRRARLQDRAPSKGKGKKKRRLRAR